MIASEDLSCSSCHRIGGIRETFFLHIPAHRIIGIPEGETETDGRIPCGAITPVMDNAAEHIEDDSYAITCIHCDGWPLDTGWAVQDHQLHELIRAGQTPQEALDTAWQRCQKAKQAKA